MNHVKQAGQGAVEYALLLMLLGIVAIVIVMHVGQGVGNDISRAGNGLSGHSTPAPTANPTPPPSASPSPNDGGNNGDNGNGHGHNGG